MLELISILIFTLGFFLILILCYSCFKYEWANRSNSNKDEKEKQKEKQSSRKLQLEQYRTGSKTIGRQILSMDEERPNDLSIGNDLLPPITKKVIKSDQGSVHQHSISEDIDIIRKS